MVLLAISLIFNTIYLRLKFFIPELQFEHKAGKNCKCIIIKTYKSGIYLYIRRTSLKCLEELKRGTTILVRARLQFAPGLKVAPGLNY